MKQKNLWLLVGLPASGKSTCVKNALENGENSIWVERSRRKTLNALTIPDHTVVNAVFMNTNIDTCIERNNLRQGREKVPESVIHNMAKTLTVPQESEGFDNILILKG